MHQKGSLLYSFCLYLSVTTKSAAYLVYMSKIKRHISIGFFVVFMLCGLLLLKNEALWRHEVPVTTTFLTPR